MPKNLCNYPIVSIILPTYNGKPERLSESIESVLSQTFKDFELIIINDASTNNIEETILKYKNKDSRIVYLKNNENLKLTNTLNRGIEHSKGKYIARIDDDDIWVSKDKLEKQVNFMEKNPDYGLCGAGVKVDIDDNGKIITESETKLSDLEIRKNLLKYNQFFHSSVLIRKSILNEVGVYNTDYNKAEDYELWCRLGTKSKFANLGDIKLKYRVNSNGICMKNSVFQKKLSLKICFKYKKYYPNFLKSVLYRMVVDFFLPEGVTRFFG